MNLKRLVPISLIALSLSVVIPINQVANADDTYERICLTMGWTSCGEFTIYNADGLQVNRVVGPIPCNTCFPAGGSAVLNKTFSPTPGAAEAAAAAAAAALATYNASVAAQAAAASSPTPTPTNSNTNTSDTRTVSPTPTLAPIITTGLGGYAVVHPDGHVCGVIVATSSDPFGNGGFMSVEYMGCPKWSRIVFQTTPSSSGNVAGWHGTTVTESNGQFKIGGGTDTITVRNGVATNTSGQSWDTGNGAPAAKTTDTKTVVSNTDTRTSTTLANNKITSIITISSISNVESRTVSAANLLNTYTATEKEKFLNVALNSTKSALVNVSTDIPNIKMAVTATKAGSKPIVFNIKTNSEGDSQIKTSKNLTGYTVTLSANGVKLDSDKAIKK